ncbi:MAG TPA: FAD-dependent oxidoreductase [Bacillota bacterium]|nr:FAD-dependent oxidoreductase [Peptococcaceae bacterium MAG4]NLW37723.1 FAD-dependent oxidoreductase [Peptococcaceae bacterium]HPZ43212.1 FAD-dependent oxidoreductase [Bacillota bacterium]HQD76042.1 FAD-dependent oxidoreductase [Bacillota bacterium]HUM58440.1 FAD-dependent oxidoreductase [Bacillota bacterium]
MAKKVVIVGGVAGGASAATRLRRLDETMEIVLFERGEYISFATCGLPYYVGGVIAKRRSLLVQTPAVMKKRYNLDIRTMNEVRRILPAEKQVEVCDLRDGRTYLESYDYLILSPGAEPAVPDIPGINLPNVFTVRNVSDGDRLKEYIETEEPVSAVVVGGGFIGLEMAEALRLKGVAVTVVEADRQLMGVLDPEMAAIVQKYLQEKGVGVVLRDRLTALEGISRVEKLILESGREIPAEMVVLAIGVKPEVRLAVEAGLAIGVTGGIQVDEYMRTSDPFIYAVGDAVQVKHFVTGQAVLIPLAGPANRQGRLVADNIAASPVKYKGTLGTAIVKIMDLTVAVTGANEKTLKRAGIEHLACYTHPDNHAAYYPGSRQMSIKLLFSPGEGKILGAQVVGYQGVDKCIDVLATAIRAKMNVYDLQDLELAYAPPFSSAKSPVNMLGYVASNILRKEVEAVRWEQVEQLLAGSNVLVDVRTAKELEKNGAVAGALNIPLDELRDRLAEIPEDREVLTYCQAGQRSYIANRILRQKGYKVKNISGGYRSYLAQRMISPRKIN